MKNNPISQFLNKQNETTIQFIKYFFVGGTSFVVDFSVYFFFTDIVHLHYLLASTLSFIAGLLTNYTLGTLFVFGGRKVEKRSNEFLLVTLISIGGMLLTLLFLWLLTEQMHIHYLLSKAIASVLVLVYNFSLRKKVVYK